MISGQTELALRMLRGLSRGSGSMDVARLAATLGTTQDRLLELGAPLTYAGWVTRDAVAGAFRYTRPVPPPTVHDVVDAVEGAGVIDDCVLRPGVSCAALQGAAVCGDHAAWGRFLNASALAALPLAALVRGPVWHASDPRGAARGGARTVAAEPPTGPTIGAAADATAVAPGTAAEAAGPDDVASATAAETAAMAAGPAAAIAPADLEP